MVRVSIKPYLVKYLDLIGQEMGCEGDYSTIVNHVLLETRRNSASTTSQQSTHTQEPTSNDDNALADNLLNLLSA